jgi:metallophosphoesterase (TIGR00282 family)
MRVLFFADIFGKPGRKAVAAALPRLKAEYSPDFIIGNAENLAGGRGVNHRTFNQLINMGFNASDDGKPCLGQPRNFAGIFEKDNRLLRPANFPDSEKWPCPGKGFEIYEANGFKLCVVNLIGRVFMADVDCPFQVADKILGIPRHVPIFVDMHADATSEKNAMGWFLAGKVAAVVGSHAHVQTADERILPGGTAYISDVGMSGSSRFRDWT